MSRPTMPSDNPLHEADSSHSASTIYIMLDVNGIHRDPRAHPDGRDAADLNPHKHRFLVLVDLEPILDDRRSRPCDCGHCDKRRSCIDVKDMRRLIDHHIASLAVRDKAGNPATVEGYYDFGWRSCQDIADHLADKLNVSYSTQAETITVRVTDNEGIGAKATYNVPDQRVILDIRPNQTRTVYQIVDGGGFNTSSL